MNEHTEQQKKRLTQGYHFIYDFIDKQDVVRHTVECRPVHLYMDFHVLHTNTKRWMASQSILTVYLFTMKKKTGFWLTNYFWFRIGWKFKIEISRSLHENVNKYFAWPENHIFSLLSPNIIIFRWKFIYLNWVFENVLYFIAIHWNINFPFLRVIAPVWTSGSI